MRGPDVTARPRLGLALGGGSARGWSHIGVIHALEARGIVPQVIAGASVGALVAAARANGRLADLESWVVRLTQRDVWRLMDTVFRGGGVMTGNRLMAAIAGQIGDPLIEELPMPFGAVATDLYTGEEVWLRAGSMMAAVRASSGLPGLFAPSWYHDRWLIDGGIVNPVPVSLCRALGAQIVIAVDLSRPVTRAAMRATKGGPSVALSARTVPLDVDAGAGRTAAPAAGTGAIGNAATAGASDSVDASTSAERAALLRKWSGLMDGLIESFRARRNEPGLFEVMASAVGIMQDRIARSRLAADPADLVLRPDLGQFQLMDFHRAREVIELGHRCVDDADALIGDILDDIGAGLAPQDADDAKCNDGSDPASTRKHAKGRTDTAAKTHERTPAKR